MSFRNILFLFLSVFCLPAVRAQQPVTRNYLPKDGLPSTESYSVLTDHTGFLWITTDAGLSRFNGYSFKNFSIHDGLPETTIFKLFEDHKNRMWFTTLNSRVGFVSGDSIQVIPSLSNLLTATKNASYLDLISSLYVDSGDTLWLGTCETGRLIRIAPPYQSSKPEIILNQKNFMLTFHENGKQGSVCGYALSTGEPSTRLLTISRDRNKENAAESEFAVPDNTSAKLYMRYKKDGLLIASMSRIFLLDKSGLRMLVNLKDQVIAMNTDENGCLWVSGAKQGVCCYPDLDHPEIFTRYFEGNTITGMAVDFEGSYWFTSLEKGLIYMPRTDFIKIGKEDGMINSRISQTEVLTGDTLAAQSYSGDLYLYRGRVIKTLSNTGMGLFKSPFFPDKLFYTGRFPGYCDTRSFQLHPFKDHNKVSWYINHYATDRHGVLYGSHPHWIVSFSPDNEVKVALSMKERVNTFIIDKQGVFWIGTTEGLISWDKDKDKKLTYWAQINSLLGKRTDQIVEDEKGRLWLATRGNGLLLFDKNKNVQVIDSRSGLSSDFCRILCPDTANTMWVGTNSGLCKVDKNSLTVSSFGFLNELISGEVSDIKLYGGNILLSTSEGVYSFKVQRLNKLTRNPPIFITNVSSQSNKSIQDQSILPYSESRVKLSFLGLSYFEAGKTEYVFKLEGVDADWRHTRELSVEYSNLPPGSYRFVVKPTGDPSVIMHSAQFCFTITPPFWRTFWFAPLVILLLIAFIILYFRYSINKVQKKEQEKAKTRETVARLEATALRAQMNPHFIFNALNSIQNFILKNEKKVAQDFLIKFSRLIRNVLEFSKSDFITVADEIQTLDLYIQLEKLRAADRFTYVIEVDPGISEHALIPSMILQPFIENAILHGLIPKSDGEGLLRISLQSQSGNIKCTIEDNGIGRIKSAEIKSKKLNYHKSMGLSVTSERLDLLKRENHFNATCNVEDLKDEEGTVAGTRVTILFEPGHSMKREKIHQFP